MIWMVKFLHLSAISVWMGGLVVVPFLLWQRSGLRGEPLHRLHRLVRSLYVQIASPAAFVAIASGTALIFLQVTFVEWFSIKLVFVGGLAALHVWAGLLILRVFVADGQFGSRHAMSMSARNWLVWGGLVLGSVVMGTLITAVLSLGWYSWPAIGGAAAIGFLITWPASYVVSRLIKRDDPSWDETKVDRVDGIVPEKSAPEV